MGCFIFTLRNQQSSQSAGGSGFAGGMPGNSDSSRLLDKLANSPSPGERLATVGILPEVLAGARSFLFLMKWIDSEKPFVGSHANKALRHALGALDPRTDPQLMDAIHSAQAALDSASVGSDTDRQTLLRAAEREPRGSIQSFAAPAAPRQRS